MTEEDKKELRRLAAACPWEAIESFEYPAAGGKAYCLGSGKTEHLLTTFDRRFQQYIEAARPAVVLDLLDELERAELVAAKAGQGEPVAWVHPDYLAPGMESWAFEASRVRLSPQQVPLYTAPPTVVQFQDLALQMLSMLQDLDNGYPWSQLCLSMDTLRADAKRLGVELPED